MKRIHVMGIGGSGASAAASVAAQYGFTVTGCDMAGETEYTASIPASIQVQKGHDPSHVAGIDALVVSPAVLSLEKHNAELVVAKEHGIPIMTWPDFVGSVLQKGKYVIAICGTHGKSTTTALVGLMLEQARFDPTVILGAVVPQWSANFRAGTSAYFVIEADEYNDSFHAYRPNLIVLTNLEYDHPEFFSSFDTMVESFTRFVGNLTKEGTLVFDPHDAGVDKLAVLLKAADPSVTLRKVGTKEQELAQENVKLPGEFNQQNAALAYAAVSQVGVKPEVAKQVLQDFRGVRRRFELVGEVDDIEVYDDYAHHPTAIAKTLQVARDRFLGKRLWVLWEPHMFTRTKVLFKDFVKTFREGIYDRAVVVDIYPARERDPGDISSEQLVAAIGDSRVEYRSMSQAAEYIARNAKQGDVVLCIGAGESSKASRAMLACIKEYHG